MTVLVKGKKVIISVGFAMIAIGGVLLHCQMSSNYLQVQIQSSVMKGSLDMKNKTSQNGYKSRKSNDHLSDEPGFKQVYKDSNHSQYSFSHANLQKQNQVVRQKTKRIEIPLQYSPKRNQIEKGKVFLVNETVLQKMQLPPKRFVILNNETVRNFVFGTAASSNHFLESLPLISSIQHYFPKHTVIYYNIGLSDEEITNLTKLCNVKVRKFNFNLYPSVVSILKGCPWKPVVIQELLSEFGGVLYLDASVRVLTSNFENVYKIALQSNGVVLMTCSSMGQLQATHPDMHSYLPISLNKDGTQRKHLPKQYQAGTVMLYNTKDVYWNIIHWWTLCALDERCMMVDRGSPSKSHLLECTCKHHQDGNWCCHRYDQSALNTLVLNFYDFNTSIFALNKNRIKGRQKLITVQRNNRHIKHELQKC